MDIERLRKLVAVARMYYEDDLNQSQIAKALGVSRPLISVYLSEAKELGIVEFRIKSPFEVDTYNLEVFCDTFNIQGGALIHSLKSNVMTEDMIINSAYDFIYRTASKSECIGIGWGNMIGNLVNTMEHSERKIKFGGEVCTLVGNAATANRNYHTDELCKNFAKAVGSRPVVTAVPAFYETGEDLQASSELQSLNGCKRCWNNLQMTILNVENHPSVPDLASASRFGNKLKYAVGHMASYYYDKDGNIIQSERDNVLRAPIDKIRKSDIVIGLCGCNVTVGNLIGALRTGLLTHVFAERTVAQEAIKQVVR